MQNDNESAQSMTKENVQEIIEGYVAQTWQRLAYWIGGNIVFAISLIIIGVTWKVNVDNFIVDQKAAQVINVQMRGDVNDIKQWQAKMSQVSEDRDRQLSVMQATQKEQGILLLRVLEGLGELKGMRSK